MSTLESHAAGSLTGVTKPGPTALAAVCAGVMATIAMPPFHGTGWLIVPALTLLFALLRTAPNPARTAWIFGLAHQASLLHWLFFLGPEAPIASRVLVPVAAGAAIVYASLYYLFFGWLVGLARRFGGGRGVLLGAPALWTLMECLRTVGELGFPWCLSGLAFLQSPLYPLASAGGELALGSAAAFTAALLASLPGLAGDRADGDRGRAVATTLALAVACAAFWGALAVAGGSGPATGTRAVRIAAVQANVALRDKWTKGRIDSTTVPYTTLTEVAVRDGAELVVWAETSVPAYLMYDARLLKWVRALADTNDVFLFAGFPDAHVGADGRQLRTNGSGLFGPDGRLRDRYAKHHLLPFGERMPFQALLPWLGDIDLGQAEWESGDVPAPMTVALPHAGFEIAGLICYESIFSSLSRAAVRAGADVLINITNDGWFGRTAGPVQHAEMARMRAVENGVPLIRCANNGISYFADAGGVVHARAGIGKRTHLIEDVVPGPGGTAYLRHGPLPHFIFMAAWAVFAVLLCLFRRR